MSREVKRVPLDFDWPLKQIWPGYCVGFTSDCRDSDTEKFFEIVSLKEDDFYKRIDPPQGEAWQMWEDTSAGSPMSPPCRSKEELAQWLTDNKASPMGSRTATYEEWLAMINAGWAPSMIFSSAQGLKSGVEYAKINADGKALND